MKNFCYLIVLSVIFTGCIPQKELIYLQGINGNEKNNFKIDAIKPYQLQINDILLINIKTVDPKYNSLFTIQDNPQGGAMMNEQMAYFTGITIDVHGKIRLPLVGEILVLGQTIEEVRKTIETKLLNDFFTKESGLFVNVKLSGLRITLIGEVTMPGTRTIFFDKVNVLEAIANAGDITMIGNRKDVLVIRQTPTGIITGHLDLTNKNVVESPFYQLQPNDYIYVKPLKQKSWGTGATGIQSVTTIVSVLSLATTLLVLFKK